MGDDYSFLNFGNSPEDEYLRQMQGAQVQNTTQGLLGMTDASQAAGQMAQQGQAAFQQAMAAKNNLAAQRDAAMQSTQAQAQQQQAQEAGYYDGGFTGGSSYRREGGGVHEGEFVANHNAVNNPQLLPALRLIDVAQRNNTVGRLTAADVSRAMGTGGATVVSAPTVNVQTDNSELAATLQQARDTFEKIGSLLDGGITANVSMEDFKKQEKHWDNIQNNK